MAHRLVASTLIALCTLSCGADMNQAPRAQRVSELAECRSFDALMPRFTAALSAGKTEGLRQLLLEQVSASERQGQPPPMMILLKSIFSTFGRFARLPPEAGAANGVACAVQPPPLSQANPLCEMRRAMDNLVHQGKGITAVQLIDPMLTAIFRYTQGQPPASSVPHYEVATVVQKMCGQSGVCQLNDTLDLVIAISTFAQTPQGRLALDDTRTLLKNPALQPFLTNDAVQYGGEGGIVALVRFVLLTFQGMDDPNDLNALPVSQFPAPLQADAQRAMNNLKAMLDPQREPNVLRPLQRVTGCLSASDANMELVRMLYRLWFDAKLADFSFANFVNVLIALRDTDSRGTLIQLVKTLAVAVRQDEQAVNAAARVCQLVFTPANAQRTVPELSALFSQGAVNESFCAIDTLLFGCAGGTQQPACMVPPR